MDDFESLIARHDPMAGQAVDVRSLVVNVTLRCNQSCRHCHVSASPHRQETMSPAVMAEVMRMADMIRPEFIDVTGGAPELNPHLPDLLRELRLRGHRVQLRTNLTMLAEPEHEPLAELYAEAGVELLASLPCFTERNVTLARGQGVLPASVRTLLVLNSLGYGGEDGLRLDLVYNPVGTTLPESQTSLAALFRDELAERFGIVFSDLLTMTNVPVGRFRDRLLADGGYDRYLRALRQAFNPDVLPLLTCRHQIEIGWDGRLYDCDFNLGDQRPVSAEAPQTVWDFDTAAVACRPVAHGEHCFACTAGAGSG